MFIALSQKKGKNRMSASLSVKPVVIDLMNTDHTSKPAPPGKYVGIFW